MAVNKQLDAQGEVAKKLYTSLSDASETYNERRKGQTELLRKALVPVWAALRDGREVNGCKDKLTWAKWANPSAKHPERYFYKLMGERLNSVQSDHRPLDAGIEKFKASAKGASVEVQVLGNGVKGTLSISVAAEDMPIQEYMPCGVCTWVTYVKGNTFSTHTVHPLRGGPCKGSEKSVRDNLMVKTVERALFHKLKRMLASMRLWSEDVKKLYDEASAPVMSKQEKPQRYSA
jgi:hypothetical protein